jgi:hypothetical protein
MKLLRKGECFTIDDDTTSFFLIFFAIWAVILVVASAYSGAHELSKPQAGVMLLQSPDLNQKQILINPMLIRGQFSTGSIDCVFYIYNEKTYSQNVTIGWWLGFQMVEEAKYVDFYCSAGKNFMIANKTLLECYVKFSVAASAPQNVKDKLADGNPGIYLVVTANVEE